MRRGRRIIPVATVWVALAVVGCGDDEPVDDGPDATRGSAEGETSMVVQTAPPMPRPGWVDELAACRDRTVARVANPNGDTEYRIAAADGAAATDCLLSGRPDRIEAEAPGGWVELPVAPSFHDPPFAEWGTPLSNMFVWFEPEACPPETSRTELSATVRLEYEGGLVLEVDVAGDGDGIPVVCDGIATTMRVSRAGNFTGSG